MTFGTQSCWLRVTAVTCAALIAPGDVNLLAQQPAAQDQAPKEEKPKSADQLDSLVAPIALYPDPLLAQVLAASTYPLEVVQANRWLKENPKLTGEDLTNASAKQPWDPSVQALVAFPSVLKLLDENVQWTTELGNAFIDQQSDVMDAVQRMRKKAQDNGKLTSTKEQKVEVQTVENKTVVQIVPADPQVIYVPTYSPTVVYGPPVYAYPPVSTGAVVATAAVSFGVGVMMGSFWSGCCGGGWGWGCGWGHNNIVINNNFYNRYGYTNINRTNIRGGDRTAYRGGDTWQHNPDHRRSVPYSNRDTARRFGGATGDAIGRTERFDRPGEARASTADRSFDRASQSRDIGENRASAGTFDGSGGDRVGNRSIGGDSARDSSAFSGSQSRARTEAASNRGFSSTRQSGSYGGGGRSGGGRSFGGGGRRR